MKLNFTLFLICILSFYLANAQCNGDLSLCNKKYNETTIIMTHNAYNHASDFQLPNQNFDITTQLNDGVRGLMLDVHESAGDIVVMHNFALLGSEPVEESLQEIKDFLDANVNEIITIIIESHVDAMDIETALNNVGLIPYCHSQGVGFAWPTLQQLINTDKRLIVFSEKNDGLLSQPWYHYVWDYVVDTPYSYSDPADFECNFNRGDPANELFLLNHWITAQAGIGSTNFAAVVNAHPFLYDRATQCMTVTGKQPNFLGVDFYDLGNPFLAADLLNGITTSNAEVLKERVDFQFFPNPMTNYAILDLKDLVYEDITLRIFDAGGREVLVNDQLKSNKFLLKREKLLPGVYYFQIHDYDTPHLGHGKFLVF